MHPLVHCFFIQYSHIVSVAISSPPTSSTSTIACCVGTFYLAILCTTTVVETFSVAPLDIDTWLGASIVYDWYR
jgi:methylthioribose-1-phosphate isomerase